MTNSSTDPNQVIEVEDDIFHREIADWALPLLAQGGEEIVRSGTAVFIHPALAITAKHVILDYWERLVGRIPEDTQVGEDFTIISNQLLSSGDEALWSVSRVYLVEDADLAVLYLLPLNDTAKKQRDLQRRPRFSLVAPPVGSRVAAYGFSVPENDVIDIREFNVGDPLDWEDRPISATGIVSQVFLAAEPGTLAREPCFVTNARFDGGMSGGPVFNQDSELCGVVSWSMPPGEGEVTHTSVVVTLGPLLDVSLMIPVPNGERPLTLRELAAEGEIDAHPL